MGSLAEIDKKSAKSIANILNQKNKNLRFSVVDQAIQSYWKKQESNRRHGADALQTKIIKGLDSYISSARERKKKLNKENSKIQRSFIECKKETLKLKQIGLKEWQKLEEQIQKNEQHKKANKLGKIKDLKSLQNKCSAAFAKYESYVNKLNDLEQSNHSQACQIGELLHESQKYASDRLSMHYNMAVSSKKFFDGFIGSNKSIVQSKAPPLNDILWRWLTFPKNHQTHSLPCTSKEVLSKQSIGQSFKRRVELDYQTSKFLKAPKSSSKSPKAQQKNESAIKQQSVQQQNNKKEKKEKKEKHKKQKKKVKEEEKVQTAVDDEWDVDFGGDDKEIPAMNDFNADNNKSNIVSDDDFFAAASEQNDIFGTVENIKQPKVEKTEQTKEKDLLQQHKDENVEMNGFDAGFDDNFDFGNNKDLDIAQENIETDKGFGGDWNANFDDQDLFGTNDENVNNEQVQNEEEDVDNLFAASAANDIFGTEIKETLNENVQNNDDLFSNNFGNNVESNVDMDDNKKNEDVFGDEVGFDFDATTNDDDGALFDDEFDDEQAIEFPEFDINETTKPKNIKKTKSKQKKKEKEKKPQSSPQPNQITDIPEPVISFDAPFANDNGDNADNEDVDDNPFGGSDPFGGDADDDMIDGDNPFAFDEPDNDTKSTEVDDEFDPFG